MNLELTSELPSVPPVGSMRLVRPHPRTFQHFPEEDKCPVCGTNDDGETVLIALDGTGDGSIAEAKPFHLACAVAQQYRQDMKIIYRHVA